MMTYLFGFIGIFSLLGMAYLFSQNRSSIHWPLVGKALLIQFILALLVLGVPSLSIPGPLAFLFSGANDLVVSLLSFTRKGGDFVFGQDLFKNNNMGFFLALLTIIFMSSLVAVFYHLNLLQKIVNFMALIMQKLLGTSGAESLAAAANVFVGQTEAPLVVKPFLPRMTRSELFSVMTGGMATVAGGVMMAYVGFLVDRIPEIAGHLLTASVMSAPAALAFAKILIPEKETPETLGKLPQTHQGKTHTNVIEAAASGSVEGLKLAANVAAMLISFVALIALFDAVLAIVGGWIGFSSWGQSLVPDQLLQSGQAVPLSLSLILGWVFQPLAWLMGIPWEESSIAGALLGQKIVINEFVAYMSLADVMNQLSDRTVIILSYALCGFANFSSIAIQVGGIGSLAPSRRGHLSEMGLLSVLGGSLAAFMTACIAGLLI